MGCHDLREHMSAYIDGHLPPDDRVALEEHLRSCAACRTELNELRKTVELMGKIEEVEPPRWLTQKTMERIKAGTPKRRHIIRKLFFPLHIKLPLEAVAVVMVAAVSLYVFRTIPADMRQEPGRETAVGPRTPAAPQLPPPALPRAQTTEAPRQGALRSLPASGPAENIQPADEPVRADSSAETRGESAPAKREEKVMRPAPAGIVREEQTMRAAAPPVRSKEYFAKERAVAKGDILVLTLSVADVDTSVAEFEKELRPLGGRITRKDAAGRAVVLDVEIEREKFHRLYERLNVIGKIREREPDVSDLPGALSLKIEFLAK